MTVTELKTIAKISYKKLDDLDLAEEFENNKYIKLKYTEENPLFDMHMQIWLKTKKYNDDWIAAHTLLVFYFKSNDSLKVYLTTRKLGQSYNDQKVKYFSTTEKIHFNKNRTPTVCIRSKYFYASFNDIRMNMAQRMSLSLRLRELFFYFYPNAENIANTATGNDYIPLSIIKKCSTHKEAVALKYKGFPSYETVEDKMPYYLYQRVCHRFLKKDAVDFLEAVAMVGERWRAIFSWPAWAAETEFETVIKRKKPITSDYNGFTVRVTEDYCTNCYTFLPNDGEVKHVNTLLHAYIQ